MVIDVTAFTFRDVTGAAEPITCLRRSGSRGTRPILTGAHGTPARTPAGPRTASEPSPVEEVPPKL